VAPSRFQTPAPPVKHTSLHNRFVVLNALKLTYSKLECLKFSWDKPPEPPLLDPPLNTMNRAANCLMPALIRGPLFLNRARFRLNPALPTVSFFQ